MEADAWDPAEHPSRAASRTALPKPAHFLRQAQDERIKARPSRPGRACRPLPATEAWCVSNESSRGIGRKRVVPRECKARPFLGRVFCFHRFLPLRWGKVRMGVSVHIQTGRQHITQLPQPHRKPLRLPGYDYSQPGGYFVTIVTYGRYLLFEDASLKECVSQTWTELPTRFPQVSLDTFVVMPNHLHGIVIINSRTAAEGPSVGAIHELPLHPSQHQASPPSTRAERRHMLLPRIIGYFKMNSAKRINRLRNSPGTPVWQRSYHEHVIRSEAELTDTREYIQNNPLQWELDKENPITRRGNS